MNKKTKTNKYESRFKSYKQKLRNKGKKKGHTPK